jgi:hypothetical protein
MCPLSTSDRHLFHVCQWCSRWSQIHSYKTQRTSTTSTGSTFYRKEFDAISSEEFSQISHIRKRMPFTTIDEHTTPFLNSTNPFACAHITVYSNSYTKANGEYQHPFTNPASYPQQPPMSTWISEISRQPIPCDTRSMVSQITTFG